jgi:signal transduction histidine kinase
MAATPHDAADPEPRSSRSVYEGPRNRLDALIDASQALIASADLRTLLGRILDLATHHGGADRGSLFLLRPESGRLVSTIFHGDELAGIELPAGKGIAGQVALTGEAVRINDVYADERFDRSVDERTGYRTRNLLAVPMRLRDGEILGVVELLNKSDGDFDGDDEAFLTAFGAQAAVAIQNARLVEERIRGARLEAVGTLAAGLVHDLRNPLSGIIGYADLIRQDPPADLRERCVGGIRRQVKRMNHMVGSILEYVRGEETFLFSKIDLDEVMKEVAEDLEATHAGDDVTVTFEAEPVGSLRADPMALRRLLDNLARNAVEAMSGKGHLRLAVGRDGDDAWIEVADDGAGMTEEQQARLFMPFATEGKRHGTGLGLAIVSRIVDAHGGSILLDSAPGKGTTIRVRFPFAGPPADESA